MLPPINLGQTIISDDFPTGWDSKGLPEYELMHNEIVKISSLHGESTINWETVEHAATVILKDHSKDILTATYLCAALSKNYGYKGWHTGTIILIDILNIWWDKAFPPLKRMRARVNNIDWWHDRSILFFSSCEEPISAELYNALDYLISKMDNVIKTLLPDASPLYNLREALRHISIISPPLANLPENEKVNSEADINTTNTSQVSTQNPTPSPIATVPIDISLSKDAANRSALLFTEAQQYFSMCLEVGSQPGMMTAPLT